MSSIFDFNMSDISSFNLSFLVDIGQTKWFQNSEEQDSDYLSSSSLKSEIPKNQIFRINSLIFNIEKHKNETLSKYDCYYSEDNNSLSVIFSSDISYADFTKEIMMNLIELTQKVGIDVIYFLIDKKNKQYARIIQDLMIVGFENDEINKTAKIGESSYRILKMDVNDCEEEEDIDDVELEY